eukprot:TRINITY_DN9079_c0_g2_i1.p1 TRINITY_DN9079_c0_g2~~TRINITY_DN9079_c0_g2_i1.p1  ORF type:complete len:345 (-),score=54.75 TRINITY_DN9079_c0_g2_i1:542-1576(-)
MSVSFEGWSIFVICLLSVVMVTILPTYYKRRMTYPLSQRKPMLATFEIITTGLTGIYVSAEFAFTTSPVLSVVSKCFTYLCISQILLILVTGTTVSRCAWLVTKDIHQQMLSMDADHEHPQQRNLGTFVVVVKLAIKKLGNWSIVICVTPVMAVRIAQFVLTVLDYDHLVRGPDVFCVNSSDAVFSLETFLVVYSSSLSVIGLCLLSRKPDIIALKAELGSIVLITIVSFVCSGTVPGAVIWMVGFQSVATMIVLSYPLLLSIRYEQQAKSNNLKQGGAAQAAASLDSIAQEMLHAINTPLFASCSKSIWRKSIRSKICVSMRNASLWRTSLASKMSPSNLFWR